MALTKEEILDGIAAMSLMEIKDLLDAFETSSACPPLPRWQ